MTTSNLQTTINTSRLKWNPITKEFTTDATIIGWPLDRFPWSVTLESHKTGVMKELVMVNHKSDEDGDVIWVRYEAYGMALVVRS